MSGDGSYGYKASIEFYKNQPVVFEWSDGKKKKRTSFSSKNGEYYTIGDVVLIAKVSFREYLRRIPKMKEVFPDEQNEYLELILSFAGIKKEVEFGWRIREVRPDPDCISCGKIWVEHVLISKKTGIIAFEEVNHWYSASTFGLSIWEIKNFELLGKIIELFIKGLKGFISIYMPIGRLSHISAIRKKAIRAIGKKIFRTQISKYRKKIKRKLFLLFSNKFKKYSIVFVTTFLKELVKRVYLRMHELQIYSKNPEKVEMLDDLEAFNKEILIEAFGAAIEKLISEIFADLTKDAFKNILENEKLKIPDEDELIKFEDADPMYIPILKRRLTAYLKAMFIKSVAFTKLKILILTTTAAIIDHIKNAKNEKDVEELLSKHMKTKAKNEAIGALKDFLKYFFEQANVLMD